MSSIGWVQPVNDNDGHGVADEMLVAVGREPATAVLLHHGTPYPGDEFIICDDLDSPRQVTTIDLKC